MPLGEDVVDRKEVVGMFMESPLYFSMPPRKRLEFVKRANRPHASRSLREDLLSWVRTGHFYFLDR